MNLKQLQFVANVAKTNSFSRGAELSFATQPTLSNGIAQLERELGGRLFNRTTRTVELTAFGEHMLPRIKEVLHNRDELLSAADTFHNPQHKILRIGFSPLVDIQRLNRILEPFKYSNPDITLFFKECFLDDLEQRLNQQQIDIQIIPTITKPETENCYLFYQDPLRYIPAHENNLSNYLSFSLAELPTTPIILTGGGCGLNGALNGLFSAEGVTMNSYPGQAISYQVIEEWAELGIGAGILPEGKISQDKTSSFPLFIQRDQPAHFDYYWIWNPEENRSSHLEKLLHYIQTTVPSLIQGLSPEFSNTM